MNTNNLNVLGELDSDLVNNLVTSRRGLFAKSARSLGLLASAPLILATASQEIFAGGLPKQIVDTLNFALTLEYIESAFYKAGNASGVIPARYHAVFGLIAKHEAQHVAFLKGALGAAAVKPPKADFTAGG